MALSGGDYHGKIIEEFNRTPPAFKGQAVRIRPFWTRSVLANPSSYANSFVHLNTASKILQNHTLSLDKDIWNGYSFVLEYDYPVYVEVEPEGEQLSKLRDMMENPVAKSPNFRQENRLLVLFAHTDTTGSRAIMHVKWLPWVIVDPRGHPNTLAHEMGHACRCAHVDGSVMDCDYLARYDNFFNIQAHEIYRSYWCTGPRPQNWWAGMLYDFHAPNSGPYMWPPYDKSS